MDHGGWGRWWVPGTTGWWVGPIPLFWHRELLRTCFWTLRCTGTPRSATAGRPACVRTGPSTPSPPFVKQRPASHATCEQRDMRSATNDDQQRCTTLGTYGQGSHPDTVTARLVTVSFRTQRCYTRLYHGLNRPNEVVHAVIDNSVIRHHRTTTAYRYPPVTVNTACLPVPRGHLSTVPNGSNQ